MYVLYLKDSEHIEDTLTYMGAQQCTIALMNIKIRNHRFQPMFRYFNIRI